MASETTYFTVDYDNEASGPFVAEGANLTWTGGVGFVVSVIDNGTTGTLQCALVSGPIPTNNLVLTQGTTTADTNGPKPNGDAATLLYPAYQRVDSAVAAGTGATTWVGPALGTTHSFFFDGQTSNVVAGEVLTFSGGQKCEVITVESDAGATGELSVRWITPLDTLEFPDDNDTFTGDIAGDGTLNGVVHPRCYSAINLHRFYSALNTDPLFAGNDVISVYNPTPSAKDTDQIVRLLNATIDDTYAQHMFGGSVEQSSGATKYSGLALQVTDKDDESQPVVIKDDAIVTAYWEQAFMPDSIIGKIRILLKVRDNGVDIDGRRVKGKLLRYGDSYFEGATVLGDAETSLALFSAADGNNQTAEGTVAGAPYNTVVVTEGYQLIDYNNGNGAQPFALEFDFGSATSAQTYERTKYIQRRGTSETLFGRNAQLFTGVTFNVAYDAEAGGPFTEDEVIAWGTEIPYTGGTGTPFTIGEVVVGGTSGARGRVLYDDGGVTGTLIVAQDAGATAFSNTETITGQTSGDTATSGTVVTNANAGTMVLMALDDNGVDGFLYGQRTRGVAPADNQTMFGSSSGASADADTATSLQSRVINNQLVGSYTGTAYNPANFGVAIDPSDAIASDLFTDLLGATQQPPNNQTARVTSGQAGDWVTVYPWDGTTTDVNGDAEPDFNEATVASSALVAGVSTTVQVSSIPANTPQTGYLRIERDSDNERDLVEYASWTGTTYTLVGTAPSAAAIGNEVMRAPLDQQWATTGVDETFTAVYTTDNQWVIRLTRGGENPIKPGVTTATFGSAGFSAAPARISDA